VKTYLLELTVGRRRGDVRAFELGPDRARAIDIADRTWRAAGAVTALRVLDADGDVIYGRSVGARMKPRRRR
jgi:hypothetical protein